MKVEYICGIPVENDKAFIEMIGDVRIALEPYDPAVIHPNEKGQVNDIASYTCPFYKTTASFLITKVLNYHYVGIILTNSSRYEVGSEQMFAKNVCKLFG